MVLDSAEGDTVVEVELHDLGEGYMSTEQMSVLQLARSVQEDCAKRCAVMSEAYRIRGVVIR